jgi:cold shock protein
MNGTVARMVVDRGFGFIRGDDGREYFFHRSALHGVQFEELAPGSLVVFQRGGDPGDEPGEGPRAVSVALAPGAEPSVDPATEISA